MVLAEEGDGQANRVLKEVTRYQRTWSDVGGDLVLGDSSYKNLITCLSSAFIYILTANYLFSLEKVKRHI